MNIESRFGFKDSFATAVILVAMLVFILVGVVSGAQARSAPRTGEAASTHNAPRASQTFADVQKLEPIIVTASRRASITGAAGVASSVSTASAANALGASSSPRF